MVKQGTPEWRWIPGWEGLYEVSDGGDVRSVRSGRILRPHSAASSGGYPRVMLLAAPRRKCMTAHTAVALAFIGPRTGDCIRHLDGDPANNHVTNLAYGTWAENMADQKRHGTFRTGNMAKTHCQNGHPLAGDNLTHGSRGERVCRICRNAWAVRARAKKKERSDG